jgi:hypothetical protein
MPPRHMGGHTLAFLDVSGNEHTGLILRSVGNSRAGPSPMTKGDDFRTNALETLDLANRASTVEDKARLLNLTEKWVDLAERVHRTIRSRASKHHPLIRAKLPEPDRHEGQ